SGGVALHLARPKLRDQERVALRIGLIRSVFRGHYAVATSAAEITPWTSFINFRFSGVPLVPWPKRHGLCRCRDRHDQHYDEKPHGSFLLAKLTKKPAHGCNTFQGECI